MSVSFGRAPRRIACAAAAHGPVRGHHAEPITGEALGDMERLRQAVVLGHVEDGRLDVDDGQSEAFATVAVPVVVRHGVAPQLLELSRQDALAGAVRPVDPHFRSALGRVGGDVDIRRRGPPLPGRPAEVAGARRTNAVVHVIDVGPPQGRRDHQPRHRDGLGGVHREVGIEPAVHADVALVADVVDGEVTAATAPVVQVIMYVIPIHVEW